jgi:biopolymer transport protein ExbD
MAFSSNSSAGAPMCDINTTPLVDVMLVLLIIFMITAPMMTNKTDAKVPLRSINVDPNPVKPTIYTVDVQATAANTLQLAFEGQVISQTELLAKLKAEAAKGTAMGEINLRTDPQASYEHMAQTIALIKSAKIEKIRFDELNPPGLVQQPGAAPAVQ